MEGATCPAGARQGISVVIPCLNAAHTIAAQLLALEQQECQVPYEVIVSDNGSEDHLPDVIAGIQRTTNLDLRVVDASSVVGVNHARNRGTEAARYDLVLLCDADDVVLDGWLTAYARAADDCALLGGRRVSFRDGEEPPTAAPDAETSWSLGTLGFLPYPIGANCGFQRSVWEEIGGFDERFVRGADEVDFFWRAQLAGYQLCPVADAVIAYRERSERRSRVRTARLTSIGHVRLYATHRENGFTTRNPMIGLARRLARIAVRTPGAAAGGEGLTEWLCEISALAGRIQGGLRFRAMCF